MKRKILRLLSVIACCCILLLLLTKCADVMRRKESDQKYLPFFEHADDIDVLFMGSSHVINAVYPMELWEHYGITSYNFGGHQNQLPTTYWVMENALDYAEPKVVVIDCLYLLRNDKTASTFENMHLSFDAFPLSVTKTRAVFDLLDREERKRRKKNADGADTGEKHGRLDLLWDYSVYHVRWEELSKEDFVVEATKEYGAESRVLIAKPGPVIKNPGTKYEGETAGIRYLKKMIESCRKKGIDVVLTFLPYPIGSENLWQAVNTVYDIAKEYDVPYIDFYKTDTVDLTTDCFDADSHLNPSGAWKVTDHLGKYLRDSLNVPDHRGDAAYRYWDDDYAVYRSEKLARLDEAGDLNTYLMLLSDPEMEYAMSVGDMRIYEDEVTAHLLAAKGIEPSETASSIPDIEAPPVSEHQIGFIVYDRKTKEVLHMAGFALPEEIPEEERRANEFGVVVMDSYAQRIY